MSSLLEEVEDAHLGSALRRRGLNRMIGLDARKNPLEAVHVGSAPGADLVVRRRRGAPPPYFVDLGPVDQG